MARIKAIAALCVSALESGSRRVRLTLISSPPVKVIQNKDNRHEKYKQDHGVKPTEVMYLSHGVHFTSILDTCFVALVTRLPK